MNVKEADIMDWQECKEKFVRKVEVDEDAIEQIMKNRDILGYFKD